MMIEGGKIVNTFQRWNEILKKLLEIEESLKGYQNIELEKLIESKLIKINIS